MQLTPEEKALIRQRRLAQMPAFTPKEYTDVEKLDLFDKLYNMALANYNHAKEHGHREHDIEHWMYEAVMNLLGKDVWESYNAFQR